MKPLSRVVTRYGRRLNPLDPRLARRESLAVSYFNQGLSQKEIAKTMGVCLGTIKLHLSSARKKLGVLPYVSVIRLRALNQQLKQVRAEIDPRTSTNLYSAISMAEEQTDYAISILDKRQQEEAKQQMELSITDHKTAAAGRDE